MKTHKALAQELLVPINAVAIVREVLGGTSADGKLAVEHAGGDLVEAARALTLRRKTERMADAATLKAITRELVTAIMQEDGMAGQEIPRQAQADNGLRRISLTRILPSRWQPRDTVFDGERLWELACSIKEQGLINPIVVFEAESPENGERFYELVAGERRTRAMLGLAWGQWRFEPPVSQKDAVLRLAEGGLTALPQEARAALEAARAEVLAWVEPGENLERLHRMAVVENIERESLTPVEEARAFRGLMEAYGWSQRDLARHIGKSQGFIAQRVGLLGLAAEAQQAVNTRVITPTHARAIGMVPGAMQPAVTTWVLREVNRADTPATTRQVQNVARDVAGFLDPGRWTPEADAILEPQRRNRLAVMRWAVENAHLEAMGEQVLKLRDSGFNGNLLTALPTRLVSGSSYGEALEALGIERSGSAWERFAKETGRTCEECVFGTLSEKEAAFIYENCARGTALRQAQGEGQGEAKTWTCDRFIGEEDPVVIPVEYEMAGFLAQLGVEVIQEPFKYVRSVDEYVRGAQQAAVLKREQQERAEQERQGRHLVGLRAFLEWQLGRPEEELRHFQAHACHKCVEYRPELLERELPACRLAVEPLKARYGDVPRAPELGVLVAQDGRLLPRCERFRYKTTPEIAPLAGVWFGEQRRRALAWLREMAMGRDYGTQTRYVLFGVLAWLGAERPEDKTQDWDLLIKWVRLHWEDLGGDGAVARLMDVALSEVKARGGGMRGKVLTLMNAATGEEEEWCGFDFKYLSGVWEVQRWSFEGWPEGWPRPWETQRTIGEADAN